MCGIHYRRRDRSRARVMSHDKAISNVRLLQCVRSRQNGSGENVLSWVQYRLGRSHPLCGWNGGLLDLRGAATRQFCVEQEKQESVASCLSTSLCAKSGSLRPEASNPDNPAPFLLTQGGQNMTRRPASLGPFGKKQIFLCQG